MAEQHQVYKCAVCGIIVEVLHSGGGELVCCGAPMELRIEKTEDEGYEKHVPVIEKVGGTVIIKVGEIPHPMTAEHYIEWIEVNVDGRICKKFLKPGDAPEAEFHVSGENVQARIHCNIHGLWRDK